MNYILETERLLLREFTTDDTNFIIELVNSPGWLQFIGDRNIKTQEQAKNYLENGPLKSYADNGFGLSMVETKNNKTAIGMCGILKRDSLDGPDIGFALLPAHMGKGFAEEVAREVVVLAQNVLKLPVVYAITLPNNIRSIRLLEKIGLKFSKSIMSPTTQEELFLFSSKNVS